MEFLTSTGAFIVVLGVMIFFHEFGHFITAKAFGVRVFIFSFGFGKRLLGFKWGDTDCRLSLIPLGGYVKLEGELDDQLSEDVEAAGDERDFTSRPRWQRFLVYLAGPVMNAVLTVMVLTALYMVGFQVDASLYDRPIIGAVEAGSPAEVAGLRPGDEILAIDGESHSSWETAQMAVLLRPETSVDLQVRRGTEEFDVSVQSQSTSEDKAGTIGVFPLVRIGTVLEGRPAAEAGLQVDDAILELDGKPIKTFEDILPIVSGAEGRSLAMKLYRHGQLLSLELTPRDDGDGPKIGVGRKMVSKQFGPLAAVSEAMAWTWGMTQQTFDIMGRLITGQISPKTMMGPVGIAGAAGTAARRGIGPLFYLMAVISLQLGILNLLPLPPLDGGHLLIILGEGVIRRDFSLTVKMWIMNAGAVLLLLLIGLVVYSDLSKTALLGKYLP